jgi:hypothetical protein
MTKRITRFGPLPNGVCDRKHNGHDRDDPASGDRAPPPWRFDTETV